MTQVPPSGHRGAGPVDRASEEATCSQRRAWGGTLGLQPPPSPHPRPLLSANSGPPWLSRAVSCSAPGLRTDPPSPLPSSAPLWRHRWKTWGGEGLDTEACLTRETLGPLLPGVVQKRVSLPCGALPVSKDWGVGCAPLCSPPLPQPLLSKCLEERMRTATVRPSAVPLLAGRSWPGSRVPGASCPSGCSLSLPAYLPSPIAAAPSPARRQERPLGFHPSTTHIFSSRPLGALSHRKPCGTSLTAQQKRQS